MKTFDRVIGLAIVALLLVMAVNSLPKPSTDTPGWHTVVPCPDTTDDGYYNPPNGWCDDPNTTD